MVLFRDPNGSLRWFGVFAETTARRLLYFPGFSESYRYIRTEHRGARSEVHLLVDHLALEDDLNHWAIVSGDSEKEQRIDQTIPLGQKRVLWFGMTTKGPKFLRPVRASNIARELVRGVPTEVQNGLVRATRSASVEVITIDTPRAAPYQQALHFAVIVGNQSSPLYRGRVLAIPDEPGPFVRSQPLSPIAYESRNHRVVLSGTTHALQVATVWVPADMVGSVGFTCPGRIPFHTKISRKLTTAIKSLRLLLARRPESSRGFERNSLGVDSQHTDAPTTQQLNCWVKPPTVLPITKPPLRFAVGSPDGASSNSWVLQVKKTGDVYISCRDSFQDWKVSLHASGRWRLGLTSEAIRERPQLLPVGADRAWDKWSPPPDHAEKVVFAFQIVFPSRDLFLTPAHREGDKALVFVEPHPNPAMMTVISVCIVPSLDPVVFDKIEPVAGILAVIPLDITRSVQLLANYEDASGFEGFWDETTAKLKERATASGHGESLPEDLLVLVNGIREGGIRWVGASLLNGGSTIPELN